MADVDDEELLRLARKVGVVRPNWTPHNPKTLRMQLCSALGTWMSVIDLSGQRGVDAMAPLKEAALYDALLSLAGEEHPDVTKLRADMAKANNRAQLLLITCEKALNRLKAHEPVEALELEVAAALSTRRAEPAEDNRVRLLQDEVP